MIKLLKFLTILLCSISILNATENTSIKKDTSYNSRFNEICKIVELNFYDTCIIKEKFPSIRNEFSVGISEISDRKSFSLHINKMLSMLNTSHTYYLTAMDYEYYQLGAIFSKIPSIKAVFNGNKVLYPSIGIITKKIEDKIFIASVLTGSNAEKSGMLKGDEIIDVNGKPYSPIESIKNYIGKEVIFRIRRKSNGKIRKFNVIPIFVNPKLEMLNAEKASIRIIKKNGKKIGYIHIYSYAGIEYQEELVNAITWGKLKNADALIIDIRYGLGGASPAYLNIFNTDIPAYNAVDREGNLKFVDSQWRKPAVYLINNESRSGKEILAYGAKKYKLATLIGEKTAGHVTAGRLFPLSNNDLLYLAVEIAEIDGIRLEGIGVEPDIKIPSDIRYCNGKDIQLTKAIDYLLSILKKKKNNSEF